MKSDEYLSRVQAPQLQAADKAFAAAASIAARARLVILAE